MNIYITIALIVFCIFQPVNFLYTAEMLVKGKVVDNRGLPIKNVNVEISSGLRIRTDRVGNFVFDLSSINVNSEDKNQSKMSRELKIRMSLSHIGYNTLDTLVSIGSTDLSFVLTEKVIQAENLVVTATKTEKDAENHPIPTQIIPKKEIKNSGNTRLDEMISEQTGMILVEDHGKGLQIQGLDPSFALILINGEPVIGTMTGKLNFDRFNISNIKRIEIVKGPTSSLYGSNALAGVINLITDNPIDKFGFDISAKYSSFATLDLSAGANFNALDDKLGVNFHVNKFNTDGYGVEDDRVGNTVPGRDNIFFNADVNLKLSEKIRITAHGRIGGENITNEFQVIENNQPKNTIEESRNNEHNIQLVYRNKFTSDNEVNLKLYNTRFFTESNFGSSGAVDITENLSFDQRLYKAELQYNAILFMEHNLTFGMGYIFEEAIADIIASGRRNANSQFVYLQDDWFINDALNLISSIRYDIHSDYESALSPKVAFGFRLFDELRLNSSIGFGFKAPSAEELYLNWTNPATGYSVFGSTYIVDGYNSLFQSGQIESLFVPLGNLKELKPENSWSVNFGLNIRPIQELSFKFNLFRNNIRDLIEFSLIALKTNGQHLFTYANLNRVFTQGIEAQLTWDLAWGFELSAGYQYLESGDNDVIDKIDRKEISKIGSTGVVRPVQKSEYGGLFNRSAHMIQIKISYSNDKIGLNAYLRGSGRSKYGYRDMNANLILDDEKEYAPGYVLWNLTVNQKIFDGLNLQLGSNNLFDKKGDKFLLTSPGRTFFIGFNYQY